MKLKNPIPSEELQGLLMKAYRQKKIDFIVVKSSGIEVWNSGDLYWYMVNDDLVTDVGVKRLNKPWVL